MTPFLTFYETINVGVWENGLDLIPNALTPIPGAPAFRAGDLVKFYYEKFVLTPFSYRDIFICSDINMEFGDV